VFGAAAIREQVLAAWTASPARFREDANAEQDAVLGGYRDRLVVELVQNAVDSASPAPTRVLFRLRDGVLEVANTGAPLTAAGVQALATLRASAKRGASSIGHFGVGFSAVAAVSSEPSVLSRGVGGVLFSENLTRAVVAGIPELAGELSERSGQVPILRLPWAMTDEELPPDGYDTVVRLPLRDPERAHRLLAELDPSLLLMLPGLAEVTIDLEGASRRWAVQWDGEGSAVDRVAGSMGRSADATLFGDDAVHSRWYGVRRVGVLAVDLLADRPVEEQGRSEFAIAAFVPRAGWPGDVPAGLRAPQLTDEPISLPVLLSVPIPLESSRRRAIPGPVLAALAEEAAATVIELAERIAAAPEGPASGAATPHDLGAGDAAFGGAALGDAALGGATPAGGSGSRTVPLALVPSGLPAGSVDALIVTAINARLPEARLFPESRRGRDCVVLDLGRATTQVLTTLADALDGLLPEAFASPRHWPALQACGVRRLDTAAVVEALAGLSRPPEWWGELYAGLVEVPDRDALGALPVPLADGRLVTGPRGTLLPSSGLPAAAARVLATLRLRVVHPAACGPAAREVLGLLGAVGATPLALLAEPALAAALATVAEHLDEAADALPADGGIGLGKTDSNRADVELADTDLADTDLADAVLALLAAAIEDQPSLLPADLPDLADLRLPAEGGDWWPAADLVLAGGSLESVLAEDAPFGRLAKDVSRQWPESVLTAAGVLAGFAVLRAEDVLLDPDEPLLFDLDASDIWLAGAQSLPPAVSEFAAIRDLEWVADDKWPQALALLSRPELRDVVLESAYTRWWLRRYSLLPSHSGGEQSPDELRYPESDPLLDRCYDAVDLSALPGVDREILRAAGVREELPTDVDGVVELLARVADPDRSVSWLQARSIYRRVADSGVRPPAPVRVRARDGIVFGVDAVILDAPDLQPLLGPQRVLVVPAEEAGAVAGLLDLPLASELGDFAVASKGRRGAGPAGATMHRPLRVRNIDGQPVEVTWRVIGGEVHIDEQAGPEAAGRALAWAAGEWSLRARYVAELAHPEAAELLRREADFDR
jgi:hypothetical protein